MGDPAPREQADGEVLLAAAAYAVRRHLAAHPASARQREEFFGDACVGAAAAYSRYDRAGGASLFTYALRRAMGAITDGIRQRAPMSRAEFAIAPDPLAVMAQRTPASLELLAESGWEAMSSEDLFEQSHERDHVRRLLASCSPSEQLMLTAVVMYGFSLTEVARWLGITLSRAHQIQARALARLRSAVPA